MEEVKEGSKQIVVLKRGVPLVALISIKDLEKLENSGEHSNQQSNAIPIDEVEKTLHIPIVRLQAMICHGILQATIKDNALAISQEELTRFKNQEAGLTVEDAAKLIGISINSLFDLIHQKKLNLIDTADGYRVSKYDLDQFLPVSIQIPYVKKKTSSKSDNKKAEKRFLEKDYPEDTELTLIQAAAFLKISTATLGQYAKKELIKVRQVGKRRKKIKFADLRQLQAKLSMGKPKSLLEVENLSDEEKHLMDKKILSNKEAAKVLGITRSVLSKRINKGLIEVISIGNRKRISMEEINRIKNQESLLTFAETAELIGINQKKLTKFIKQQKIKPTPHGGHGYRFSRSEIDRFVNSFQGTYTF